MAKSKNILLFCGGSGPERDISVESAQFFKEQLKKIPWINTVFIELTPSGKLEGERGEELNFSSLVKIDFAIPCFHGHPGESGEVQGFFEFMNWPYLGTPSQGSGLAFNKISTKLWMEALGIPTTPYIFLSALDLVQLERAKQFFHSFGEVFVKASCQGSSIGISLVKREEELESALKLAFKHSPTVLLEKSLKGRELELALYEYQGELVVGGPGEIICPQGFYDYKEKYSPNSKAKTLPRAEGLSEQEESALKDYGVRAFKGLGLRHLARMDFFFNRGWRNFF